MVPPFDNVVAVAVFVVVAARRDVRLVGRGGLFDFKYTRHFLLAGRAMPDGLQRL